MLTKQNQDGETVLEFTQLALAHAFDLLGDERDIGLLELARAQERRLTVGPRVKVGVVEVLSGHWAGHEGMGVVWGAQRQNLNGW